MRAASYRSRFASPACSRLEQLEQRCLLSGLTTMVEHGPSSNRVDIVFLGDGYTEAELQTTYVEHIAGMLTHLFGEGEDPFPRYENFFNVHRIDVVSAESGADAPPLGIFRDTALDARYYFDGVTERLLYVDPSKANLALAQGLSGSSFTAEMQLVTVNDTRYGGGGGAYAVYAGGNSLAPEIALHELGHSFSHLADEYGGYQHPYSGPEPNAANLTRSSGGDKWSHWLGYNQPEIGVIGAYQGGQYYDYGVYRPSQTSKMRALNRPFDAVSREQIILDLYELVDPLDRWRDNVEPVAGSDPQLWVDTVDAGVINVEWTVNGQVISAAAGEQFRLSDHGFGNGTYTVSARAYDPTDWVRIHRDRLEQTVTWTVNVEGPPAAPTLLGPVPVTTAAVFEWSAIPDAVRYDLWVNDLTTGQSAVIRRTDLTTTQFTPTQPLDTRHHYIWTVRAFDAEGNAGEWGAAQRFKLVDPAQVPAIQGPNSREYAYADTLSFNWMPVDGAGHYDVWCNDETSGISGIVRNQHVVGTSLNASQVLPVGHQYIWTVRPIFADGFVGEWASAVRFVAVVGPGMPEIMESNVPAGSSDVRLAWTAAKNARRYDVWVNDLTTGQSGIVRDSQVTSTSYVPSVPLPAVHRFVWTVRALSEDGVPGPWAPSRQFQTPAALSSPTLLGPGSTGSGVATTFQWTSVAGAARYDLWVNDTTTGQMQVIRNTQLIATSFTSALQLTAGHTYTWTVRGITSSGQLGDWAAARTFRVVAAATPPRLAPLRTGTEAAAEELPQTRLTGLDAMRLIDEVLAEWNVLSPAEEARGRAVTSGAC